MENLIDAVKILGERLESGLREQGRRLGKVEVDIISLENTKSIVDSIYKQLNEIQLAPAQKWSKFKWIIVTLSITSVGAYFIGKYLTF